MMTDPLLLHGFADGQITPAERAEVEAHLRDCGDCREELAAIDRLKIALARQATASEPTATRAEAWSKCKARLDELDRAKRGDKAQGVVGRFGWAMAASVLGIIVVAGLANRGRATSTVEGADLAQIMSNVGASRRSAANPTEQGIAAELLRQARLSIDDERLYIVGMSESRMNGARVTNFTLRDGAGTMALLDLPPTISVEGLQPVAGGRYRSGLINGLNCLVWRCGERTLVLAASRAPERLEKVAEAIHEAR